MRYNTGYSKAGTYSHAIGAGSRFNFGRAVRRNDVTGGQNGYVKYLMAVCNANGVDVKEAIGGYSVTDRIGCAKAIDHIQKTLTKKGIAFNRPSNEISDKRYAEKMQKLMDEIENTNWIPMSERKPDRKYVKTLDKTGFMRTYEWNGETFVDGMGNPLTKEWERTQYRAKVPDKWAYLGKEGMK